MSAHVSGIPTFLFNDIMENRMDYNETKILMSLLMKDNYNQDKIREIIYGKLNPLERHAMAILNGDYCIIISEDEDNYTTVTTTFYHPIEN